MTASRSPFGRLTLALCTALAPSALALEACGGDDSNFVTPDDAGGGSADATVADTGADTATSDTGVDAFTPVPDAGVDSGSCADLRKDACDTCCKLAHPVGAAVLGEALLSCGCQEQLCGPTDAGAPDADAGPLGTGACAEVCRAPDAGVSARCSACITATVAKDGGACAASVSAACTASAACVAYFTCAASCR